MQLTVSEPSSAASSDCVPQVQVAPEGCEPQAEVKLCEGAQPVRDHSWLVPASFIQVSGVRPQFVPAGSGCDRLPDSALETEHSPMAKAGLLASVTAIGMPPRIKRRPGIARVSRLVPPRPFPSFGLARSCSIAPRPGGQCLTPRGQAQ